MNRIIIIFILFLFLVLIFSGCSSTQNPATKTDYYTLEYDSPALKDLPALPFVLRVERFTVAPLYNSHKIIYSDKPFRRNEYGYHKWRANPGDLVTYFLARDLRHSALFKGISVMDSRLAYSYAITGSVDEFYELDSKQTWEAVLTFTITLTRENEPDISKNIIFQKKYHTREICLKKNPQGLAEAMSKGMKKLSRSVITDIHEALSKDL